MTQTATTRALPQLKQVTLLLVLGCGLAGCGARPEQLQQRALAAEKMAGAAYAKGDAKAAQKAAKQADKAVAGLEAGERGSAQTVGGSPSRGAFGPDPRGNRRRGTATPCAVGQLAELAAALRAWPDNPLLIFLTGEQLAADGQWQKAADSLEASAAGTKDAWLAELLAKRARELRDGQGSTKALVFDARFLVPFVTHYAAERSHQTEAGKRVTTVWEAAKGLAANVGKQVAAK